MNSGSIRNGRAILRGAVREIRLPMAERHTFDFSRYKGIVHSTSPRHPTQGVEKIICTNSDPLRSLAGYSPLDRERDHFWSHAVGFETGNRSDEATNEYRRVSHNFDILQGGTYCYQHPELASVVSQLGISQLMPFFHPEQFGLAATGERVAMELDQMQFATGRTATFEPTVIIHGEPYLLEVKGVNFNDGPIRPKRDHGAGECQGGLPVSRMQQSIDIKRRLNENGFDSMILLAAYTIPGLRQFDNEPLGAYVRAVRSSPPVSHFHANLKDVAYALEMAPVDLAEQIIRFAARDAARLWKLGIIHGWIHEQNIRFDGLTDFTGAKFLVDTGFNGIATDVEMLVASSQKIMRRLLGPISQLSDKLWDTDPEEAERLEELEEELSYQGLAEHQMAAREIISNELNRQLGLKLPPVVGTTTMAAEVYEMQRQSGFANPNERIDIEHIISFNDRRQITLDDVRLPR